MILLLVILVERFRQAFHYVSASYDLSGVHPVNSSTENLFKQFLAVPLGLLTSTKNPLSNFLVEPPVIRTPPKNSLLNS